jgi:hypothetical protein
MPLPMGLARDQGAGRWKMDFLALNAIEMSSMWQQLIANFVSSSEFCGLNQMSASRFFF